MSVDELKKEGWNIDEKALNKLLEDAEEPEIARDGKKLREFVLDCDLREIASPGLANAFNSTKKELNGPIVLQLSTWRNISYPEAQKHDGNVGVCLVRLTDGSQTFKGLLFEPINKLDGNTPRGTKILLEGKVRSEGGFLMLSKRNCTVLGGTVDELVEKWKVEKFGGRTGKGASNAPKWIPFGKAKKLDIKIDKNFLAMKAVNKVGENEADDDEKTAQFKAQRMAQIEALGIAAKEDEVEIEEKVEEMRISDVLNEQNKQKRDYNKEERRLDRGERSGGRGNRDNYKGGRERQGGPVVFESSRRDIPREYQRDQRPPQSSSYREPPESARGYTDDRGGLSRGGRGRGRGQTRPDSYQNRQNNRFEDQGNRRDENSRRQGEDRPQRREGGLSRGRGGRSGNSGGNQGDRDVGSSNPRGSSRGSRGQRGGRNGRNENPGYSQPPKTQTFSLADFPAL
ncbi:unnamed protein product [Bursaphelenchus xylophilus]|uniref:(pine wood nematode) hypothetical protein n=1 Tax=Bursaphelenchus xylophilus TaxID=6326 RepID=A0A1I7RNN5_BURXY|nr:unnamed protein product [Bursaphelenchus xylophilus]CAG9124182.1 unnamed protein product [Bursaphelenchus xylophilus]